MRALSTLTTAGRRAGLTLIEAVAAIAVLGIAIPPLLSLFTGVAQAQANRSFEAAAMVVADSLMEEIASKAFEDPDASSGSFGTEEGARLEFDDIDDFDGFSQAPPTRLDGTAIPGFESLSAVVEVRVIDAANDPFPTSTVVAVGPISVGGASLVPSLEGFKEVRVRVSWPGGDHQLTSLRAPGGDGSSSGGGEPEPDDGHIDEALAASTANTQSSRRFRMDITNETAEYQPMSSISLSASGSHPPLQWIRLNNWYIVNPPSAIPLPTGDLDMTGLSYPDRTLYPNETLRMRVQFQSAPSGTVDYEIVIVFDDGSVSKIPFTLTW